MTEYFHIFILLFLVFMLTCLLNSYYKTIAIVGAFLFLLFIFKTHERKLQYSYEILRNIRGSHVSSWLNDLKNAHIRNDQDEVTRLYQIIMNMIHANNLLQHKDITNNIINFVADKKNYNILPVNTFTEPNYHICA